MAKGQILGGRSSCVVLVFLTRKHHVHVCSRFIEAVKHEYFHFTKRETGAEQPNALWGAVL